MIKAEDYGKKYSEIICRIRKKRKLSQEDLGKLTKTSQVAIQRIENGVGGTKLETMAQIAHALDLNLVDIVQEIEGRIPRPIGDLGSKWDNIVLHVDKLPEKQKEWIAEIVKQIVNGIK